MDEEESSRRAEISRQQELMDDMCATSVVPHAVQFFAHSLHSLPDRSSEDFLPALWTVHLESIVAPFTDKVDPDLRNLPLTVLTPWQPQVVQKVEAVYAWWLDVLESHAAACGMDFDTFGRAMTDCFVVMYNQVIRRHNSLVKSRPSFHAFMHGSDSQRAALNEVAKKMALEVAVATNFVIAYKYLFDRNQLHEILPG